MLQHNSVISILFIYYMLSLTLKELIEGERGSESDTNMVWLSKLFSDIGTVVYILKYSGEMTGVGWRNTTSPSCKEVL